MAILPRETNLWPVDLLDSESTATLPGRWHILHTRPNQGKAVARTLAAARVPFYLPLVRKRVISRGRQIYSFIPAFGNYVFLCDRSNERDDVYPEYGHEILLAKKTNRLVNVLRVLDQAQLQVELCRVARDIHSGKPITAEQMLGAGDYVQVRSGPFAGHEGYVHKRHSRRYLIVVITTIRYGIELQLDDCRLEQLDRDPLGLFNKSRPYERGEIEIVRAADRV